MNEGVRAKEPGCATGALMLPTTLSTVGILLLTHACRFIQTAATAAHLAADLGFEQRVLTKNMIKRLARQKT